MKDKSARVLAIIALVFEVVFVVAIVATIIDHKLFNGSIGYIALCSGVFVAMCLIALKADGRGFSMNKINNDIEMAEIERKLKEQKEKENTAEENSTEKLSSVDKNDDRAEELKTQSENVNLPDQENLSNSDGKKESGNDDVVDNANNSVAVDKVDNAKKQKNSKRK